MILSLLKFYMLSLCFLFFVFLLIEHSFGFFDSDELEIEFPIKDCFVSDCRSHLFLVA